MRCARPTVGQCWNLSLLQVQAGPTCFLFPLAGRRTAALQRLLAGLFGDHRKTFVMHDCRKTAAALFYHLHVIPANMLDTQVGMSQVCGERSCLTLPDTSSLLLM